VSNFVKEGLGLSPRQDQVHQCGDDTYKYSVECEVRLDAPAYPHGKDERHGYGRDKNGRQESLLPKEMEHWENNGEDR
jgi:hypothetical protein